MLNKAILGIIVAIAGIPLAFGLEGGGLTSKGFGVIVMGGLVRSTILALVIVPILLV